MVKLKVHGPAGPTSACKHRQYTSNVQKANLNPHIRSTADSNTVAWRDMSICHYIESLQYNQGKNENLKPGNKVSAKFELRVSVNLI